MIMIAIYFVISLFATMIGSMVGLGGGVIIKPLLDFLGDYTIPTINVLSSVTVFVMAVVSIIKQMKYKFQIEVRRTILIGIGAVSGGIIGDLIISAILCTSNGERVAFIQNIIMAMLSIFVYFYMNDKENYQSYSVKKPLYCIIIGLVLGAIASFLSIGGGPINLCMLAMLFSMDPKEAAVNSIFIILFSQGAKMIKMITTGSFAYCDLTMLPYMIVAGIIGGIWGTKLNKILVSDNILRTFNIVLVLLIFLNIYNVGRILVLYMALDTIQSYG